MAKKRSQDFVDSESLGSKSQYVGTNSQENHSVANGSEDDDNDASSVSSVIGEQAEENMESRSDDDEDEDEENETEKADKVESKSEEGRQNKRQKTQLTAQDIQVARETAELFKSNIFKLQIDELIKEVKLKESHLQLIEKALHRLHHIITLIPLKTDLTLSEAESYFNSKKVVIPFPDPKPTKANYKFSYLPPEDVNLVGSFGLKTAISQKLGSSIDIALTMPRELFQAKDYLNYRALYKRAFYLAYLADNLIPLSKKNDLPLKISYHFLNEDILCPVLKLESIETDNENHLSFNKTKCSINLIVSLPFNVFDSKKILPDKNCIRIQSDTEELPPTPIYNSSILSQTAYDYYLKYLYATKKSTDAFKDACILGKLWLKQRGMGSSFNQGGFGHFEFATLMCALLNGGGVNGNKILLHGFSSYQLFKGTIKYLSSMDLCSGYLSFSSAIGENVSSKYISDADFGVPTIFDKNLRLNILWKMTTFSYGMLRKHATDTFQLLKDVVYDRFDPILLHRADFDLMRYDLVLNLTIPEDLYDSFNALEKITFLTFENFLKHKLYLILQNGLGDRVTHINIKNEKISPSFSLYKRKSANSSSVFVLGLILNPEECDKLVTKGPSSEDEEAGRRFRSFWGPLASLRKFKDGNIQHCVVWNPSQGTPMIINIIQHILNHHLHEEASQHLSFDAQSLLSNLPIPLLPSAHSQLVLTLSSFTNLHKSFDSLSKYLTSLDLPLNVKSLLPASPALRFTSLLQPVPFCVSNPDFWNDAVLQFETSSRWPDEINALEKTKAAFLMKIKEHLDMKSSYSTFLSKDESIPFNESIILLNVLTPEGYGFKIRALTERDEVLYLRAVQNAEKHKSILQDVYLKFNLKYFGSLKHTRTISTLAHHFQFYSPTVRLFKRWLDSQLLLCHFPDELIELIAMKPFVDPAPYSTPHSVTNGFLQILSFLASWNWKDDPLILDLTKQVDQEDDNINLKHTDKINVQLYQLIELNFRKIRQADPSGVKTQFFIGSKDDPSGILWSSDLTLPISTRLTSLAHLAVQLIKKEGLNESNVNLLFTPALNDYDFVIKVKTYDLATSSGIMPSNAFKNLIGVETSFPDDLTSKYDLVQAFVHDLNRKFGNAIIFSTHNFTGLQQNGSNVIAGIFIPSSLAKKKFKVNLDVNIKPIAETDEFIINKEAIFSQIKFLGGDLVQSVKMKK